MKKIFYFLITPLMLLIAPIVADMEHKNEDHDWEVKPKTKTTYPVDQAPNFNEWMNHIFKQIK